MAGPVPYVAQGGPTAAAQAPAQALAPAQNQETQKTALVAIQAFATFMVVSGIIAVAIGAAVECFPVFIAALSIAVVATAVLACTTPHDPCSGAFFPWLWLALALPHHGGWHHHCGHWGHRW
jgi:uncharacterized membrane protein